MNIGDEIKFDSRRDDKYHNLGELRFKELITETTKFCFCPITIGGGLRSIEDIDEMFKAGADKVTVNTLCFEEPRVVKKAVERYGSQAITASVDLKREGNTYYAWIKNGTVDTGKEMNIAIDHVRELGVGEVLLSSIDNDGSGLGYENSIINNIRDNVDYPIIINRGNGS